MEEKEFSLVDDTEEKIEQDMLFNFSIPVLSCKV
jgi:hypothetical protein